MMMLTTTTMTIVKVIRLLRREKVWVDRKKTPEDIEKKTREKTAQKIWKSKLQNRKKSRENKKEGQEEGH